MSVQYIMAESPSYALALGLAANRTTGAFTGLPLAILHSRSEAQEVQALALEAYDDDFKGYALVGTSPVVRRMLGLKAPIFAAIPNKAFHNQERHICLPKGMIGAQCELALTIGKVYPARGETIDRSSAAAAVVACEPAIGLVGRRAPPGPDAELSAIADFGLHVATVCGREPNHIDPLTLDEAMMTAMINGSTVMRTQAGAALGHPLDALLLLARQLSAENRQLNTGDIVTTGSCTPILQVLPGQHLTVEFEGVGKASCRLE
jgi:2-keto-4-pentenoate hydratase